MDNDDSALAGPASAPGKRGGKRPGAGRPKKAPTEATRIDEDLSMLDLLREIALGRVSVNATQLAAARAAVQYEAAKSGDAGKKEMRQAEAEKELADLPSTPPPLRIVG